MTPELQVTIACSLAVAAATAPQLQAQDTCCDLMGRSMADRYSVSAISQRGFTHSELWRALDPFLQRGGVSVTQVGSSVHGRAINAVTFGRGPTTVLLWSQMHGDESTATMALADIIRFYVEGGGDPLRRLIEEQLQVVMVPMLNPDGAEWFQRENAVGVDVNRDARRLATPEARALKTLRDSIQPDFGFNLHDQGARTTAGDAGQRVAIALLAPPTDTSRAYGPVRDRARQLAALLATALDRHISGRVAKYDDTFNPRAFGDLIQQWGTSTVLIESGALPADPEKQELRRLNVMLLLTALEAIATEQYAAADRAAYDSLPFNRRVANDILLTGGWVVAPHTDPLRLDIALAYDDPVARRGLHLGEIGDLDGAIAMDTVHANDLYLHLTTPSTLEPTDWRLVGGEPVAIVVRRSAAADSEIVMRIPRLQ